jgi:excinuclease ABC subunit C
MEMDDGIRENIRKKIRSLPLSTGVYIFKGESGKVVYVGKANRLRSRVAQHFKPSPHDLKATAMAGATREIEYILTDSEVESHILENNLIKQHQPKFNIRLRDDKSYPWVKITVKNEYPGITIVRGLEQDGSRYYGPYLNVDGLESSIKYLRRLFPIRRCTRDIRENGTGRACLDFHLKMCLAPCADPGVKDAYGLAVKGLCMFIDGRTKELISDLRLQMASLANKQKFEEAARLRDLIRHLEKITCRQKVMTSSGKDYDAIACASSENESCVLLFSIRNGKLIGKEHFILESTFDTNPSAQHHEDDSNDAMRHEKLSAFIRQYYGRTNDVPPQIHVELEIDDTGAIEQWLLKEKGIVTSVRVPKRKDILKMAKRNAIEYLENKKPDEFAIAGLELMKTLDLPTLPRKIETIDVSTIQGRDSVGSVVVFEDGKPKKSEYRRFRIKSIPGQDDCAMLREVSLRRYGRLQRENGQLPDLVLVDGGKGQLNAVQESLDELKVTTVPIISIAKEHEQVYTSAKAEPYELPRNSAPIKLLQRARDEAHRFAVAYHRKLRSRHIRKSVLDDIPGIGRKRKKALLSHFGSLDNIKNATIEELSRVDGIGKAAAGQIQRWVREQEGKRVPKV